MTATTNQNVSPLRMKLAYLCLGLLLTAQALAVPLSLFYLLEWTWAGPARRQGLFVAAFLIVSALVAAADKTSLVKSKSLLPLVVSSIASGFFAGGVTVAYFSPDPGVGGILGGLMGMGLWAGLWLLQTPNRGTVSRGARGAAGLSSYCLLFWSAASLLSAIQGGQYGWALLLAVICAAAAAFTWLHLSRALRSQR